MTVPTTTSAVVYTATGTDAEYPFTWQVAAAADLIVYQATSAGALTLLELDTDYAVSGVRVFTGGNITLTAGNLTAGYLLFIASDPLEVQLLLLQQGAAFNPADLMNALDLLTRMVQATRRVANNSLQIPLVESLDGFVTTFPTAANRANSLPYFDENGDLTILDAGGLSPILTAGNYIVDTFTASATPGAGLFVPGTTTTLTLSQAPGTVNNAFVSFDAADQLVSTLSLSGTSITFDAPIPFGVQKVQVRQAGVLPINTPANNSVSTATIQDGAVTAAKMAPDSVSTGNVIDASITLVKLNSDVTSYIAAQIAASTEPIGSIKLWGSASIPTGWLALDGASLLRATYSTLFGVLGTTWGSADGTHFTLPDLRGRAPIGVGTGSGLSARALAATGGEETHLLTTPEMPAHTHANTFAGHSTTGGSTGYSEAAPTTPSLNTGSTGGGGAHNNMQPFAAINFIVRAL